MEGTFLDDKMMDRNLVPKRKKKRKLSGLDASSRKQGMPTLVECERSISSIRKRLKEDTDASSKLKGPDGHYFECEKCDHGGNLLCCDNCPRTYHLSCLSPPLKTTTLGKWQCPKCCDPNDDTAMVTEETISRVISCKSTIEKAKAMRSIHSHGKASKASLPKRSTQGFNNSTSKAEDISSNKVSTFSKKKKHSSSSITHTSSMKLNPSGDSTLRSGVSVVADSKSKKSVSLAQNIRSDHRRIRSLIKLSKPGGMDKLSKREQGAYINEYLGNKFDLPVILSSETANQTRKMLDRMEGNKKPKSDNVEHDGSFSNDTSADDLPCPLSSESPLHCNSADNNTQLSDTKQEKGLLRYPRKKQFETSPHVASSMSLEVDGLGENIENRMSCNGKFSHEFKQVDRILGCRIQSGSSYIDLTNGITISQAENKPRSYSDRMQSKLLHSDLSSQENHNQLSDCCDGSRCIDMTDLVVNLDKDQISTANPITKKIVGDGSNEFDAGFKDKAFVTKQNKGLPEIVRSSDSQSSFAHCMPSKFSELPEGSVSDDVIEAQAAKIGSKGSTNVEHLLSENCNGHHTSSGSYEPHDIHLISTISEYDRSSETVIPHQSVEDLRPKENVSVIYEFFVKWVDNSNIHNSWVCEDELKLLAKRKLENYKAKYGTAVINICEDQWCQPHRIISLHESDAGGDALVKWSGLPYDECTWEKIDDNIIQKSCHLITEFKRFETQALDNDARHDIDKSEIGRVLPLLEQPKELKGGLLFPHQLEALNWLRSCWYKSKNVILADEMGLGKTVSACSFISSLYFEFKVKLPCLVLVPLSTMPNWLAEFASWAPHLNVVEYHGCAKARSLIRLHEWHATVSERPHKRTKSYKFNVLLTTYEMILADSLYLRGVPWELLIVDEGHRLKNSGSKLFNLLNSFSFQHRVLLTGTPLQNNIGEMYNLLNFLQPASFPSLSAFEEKFNDLTKAEKVEELKKLVAPHMLRRLKKDAMQNIPPKTERMVPVELTSVQAEYYRAMLTKNYQILRNVGKGVAHQSMLNIVMQLRKVCNHPYLIPGTEPESGSMEFLQEMRIKASAKLALLHSMLKILHKDGHRVLIFSQMTKLLDILEDYLTVEFGYGTFERVDGSVSVTDRQAAISRFNKDKTRFVFLLSTRSCGLGINLATADTVIIYDSDFNPHADIQAMNRAHRIGQSKRLLVYRLVVRASVEERILQLAKKKLMLDQLFVNKSGSQKEVEDILRWGTEELFGDCNGLNDQVSKDNSISQVDNTSLRQKKTRRRIGGLGDVYKDRCTDNGTKLVWDETTISKLLDRSDLQKSMLENADVDLDSDLLGSVKPAEWSNEQLNGEPEGAETIAGLTGDERGASETKQDNTNTVTEENEWDKFLRDRWGKYQLEEEAALGRGKRLRKAVSYRESFTSNPSQNLIENVNEDEPVREYSPAGRVLREKYMKLRVRQKDRIARRHTVELHSSGEGPKSLMQSPVPDRKEMQCAESNVHSEDSSDLDPSTTAYGSKYSEFFNAKESDYTTSKQGRACYCGSHLSLSVGYPDLPSENIPPDCALSTTLLPVLGLCAPNASQRNSTTRTKSASRIFNSPLSQPGLNVDQRRTSVCLPELSISPTEGPLTGTVAAGQGTTDSWRLSDTQGVDLRRRLKNIIPDGYFPFGPPLLPTSGKCQSDPSKNLGTSFSSFREKFGLPNLVSDEVSSLKFAIPSRSSSKLQTNFLQNLSLCSNIKHENSSVKELTNLHLLPNFGPELNAALKQKQVMAKLPPMVNLGLLQTGQSITENHMKVLDKMIKTQTDVDKFMKKILKVDEWSEDELDALWIGVRRYGKGNWDVIARDPKFKTLRNRSVEELSSKWNEEQSKILDGPVPPPKISKSASFLDLSDGMMARALHGSKFANPGTELPKFRSHLTDIQLGFGDIMPSFPFLEPSSQLEVATESLPLHPSLQSDMLESSCFGNFSAGAVVGKIEKSNLSSEQPFYHSSFSGNVGALGMNFSSTEQNDDVSARNKRMKLPSLLEKSLSLLRGNQSIHTERSRMGLLHDARRKQATLKSLIEDIPTSGSLIEDIPGGSKANKLPHWLREAVNAPIPPEAMLPPSISAISHSVRILFDENRSTIPPFIIPGPLPAFPKDPRKRLRKKRKLKRLRQKILENSTSAGDGDVCVSCSVPGKSPFMGCTVPSVPPLIPSSIPPLSSLVENAISSSPLMSSSIPPVPPLLSCSISSAPPSVPSSIPITPSLMPSFSTSALPLMPSSLPPVSLMIPFKFPPLPLMSSSILHSLPFVQSSAAGPTTLPSTVLPQSEVFPSTSQSPTLMFCSIPPLSPTRKCSISADTPPMPHSISRSPPLTSRKETGVILPSLNLNLNFPSSSSYGRVVQSCAIPSPCSAVLQSVAPSTSHPSVSSISDMPSTSNRNIGFPALKNPEYSHQVGVDLTGDFNCTTYETEGCYDITCSLPE